jgi:Bacteriophage lambda head decoration protein D
MAQTPINEIWHDGGFIVSEANGHRSRDRGVITGAAKFLAGTVLGQSIYGAVTSAVKTGGNTGNGTFVLDPTTPELTNVQVGVYSLRCTVAGTNAATFRLTDPKGDVLGDYAFSGAGASVVESNQIKGTITDGAVDFAVGDGFDITVAAATGKFTQLTPAALDGTQYPAAILYATTDATLADKTNTVIIRSCEVNASELIWPTGFTNNQITAALAALAKLGIVGR